MYYVYHCHTIIMVKNHQLKPSLSWGTICIQCEAMTRTITSNILQIDTGNIVYSIIRQLRNTRGLNCIRQQQSPLLILLLQMQKRNCKRAFPITYGSEFKGSCFKPHNTRREWKNVGRWQEVISLTPTTALWKQRSNRSCLQAPIPTRGFPTTQLTFPPSRLERNLKPYGNLSLCILESCWESTWDNCYLKTKDSKTKQYLFFFISM